MIRILQSGEVCFWQNRLEKLNYCFTNGLYKMKKKKKQNDKNKQKQTNKTNKQTPNNNNKPRKHCQNRMMYT
jgi:hypothetical protein